MCTCIVCVCVCVCMYIGSILTRCVYMRVYIYLCAHVLCVLCVCARVYVCIQRAGSSGPLRERERECVCVCVYIQHVYADCSGPLPFRNIRTTMKQRNSCSSSSPQLSSKGLSLARPPRPWLRAPCEYFFFVSHALHSLCLSLSLTYKHIQTHSLSHIGLTVAHIKKIGTCTAGTLQLG